MYELSFTDLDDERDVGTGAGELSDGRAAALDTCAQPSAVRIFRSLDPCCKRCRLRDLSWARGSDVLNVPGRAVDDGVVHILSPGTAKLCPAARRSVQHGMAAAGESSRNGNGTRAGVPDQGLSHADKLFDVP